MFIRIESKLFRQKELNVASAYRSKITCQESIKFHVLLKINMTFNIYIHTCTDMYLYFSCLELVTRQKLNDVTSLHVRCVSMLLFVTGLQVTMLHLPYIIKCNGHVL